MCSLTTRKKWAPRALALLQCVIFNIALAQQEVKVGVLAYRGADFATHAWAPTADYLSQTIPGYRFSVVPLDLDTLSSAINQKNIEFVLTNPGSFATLEKTKGVARLATLRRKGPKGDFPLYGAVIFSRSDRADITRLEDVKGKTMMAVHPEAFGGWWMAWGVLKEHDIDPKHDLAKLKFSGFPHDKIVYAVHERRVDVGTVRSSVLEDLAEQGRIDLHDFRILNAPETFLLPFSHSTPLYPGWPIATVPHTPRHLAQDVAIALWQMPESHPAARAANIAGWTVPLDYKPVHDLMNKLAVGPYAGLGAIDFAATVKRYGLWLAAILVMLTMLGIYSIHVAQLNRRLSTTNTRLSTEIEERAKLSRQLEYQALHDALTHLPNRALFNDRLLQTLYQSQRENGLFAVILLDLDEFKNINDSLGHQCGDQLLVQVAERFERTLRKTDTLARLGGDEFVILVPGIDRLAAAAAKAQELVIALKNPFELGRQTVYIGASIGIAVFPIHGRNPDILLQHADIAMYSAKKSETHFALYDDELGKHPNERFVLQNDINRALDQRELTLCYQPIVSCQSSRTIGLEALVRWHHPRLGLLHPASFIPLLENTPTMMRLTLLTITTALADTRQWYGNGASAVHVSINISPSVIHHPSFCDEIERVLRETPISPHQIEFEITAGTIADIEAARKTAEKLTQLGIVLSLDAFSQKHSSIHYLKTLPIRKIKVDKSLVNNVVSNRHDRSLVRSTVDLGHAMGLSVIVEGIENERTWQTVQSLGCDAAQGFYVSEPMPPSKVSRWLTNSPWGTVMPERSASLTSSL